MRRPHRVTIQSPTATQGDSGALEATWSAFAARWAEIITSGGREFVAASAIHGELSCLIRMRGYCAVTNKMRAIPRDGRILEIVAAYSPDGRTLTSAPEILLACRDHGETAEAAGLTWNDETGTWDEATGTWAEA